MEVGDSIEDFTLIDDQGTSWTLSEFRGRTVLLVFHRHLM